MKGIDTPSREITLTSKYFLSFSFGTMVIVLKFQTLCFILFWPNFAFYVHVVFLKMLSKRQIV